MSTRISGHSDDLIEFEGDVDSEFPLSTRGGKYAVLVCSDGTVLKIRYGKESNGVELGIWEIIPLVEGTLFDRLEPCFDEDGKLYSDIVHLKDGCQWIIVTKEWSYVR